MEASTLLTYFEVPRHKRVCEVTREMTNVQFDLYVNKDFSQMLAFIRAMPFNCVSIMNKLVVAEWILPWERGI